MQSRKITAALIVKVGMALAGSVMAAEPEAPVFGGWRNLHSANGAAPVLEDLPFAILPRDVAKGSRFAVLDRENKQAVCCLVVDSERLDAIALETRYRLPGVWIADLLGNEDFNQRHGDRHVFAMKREDALVDHVFSDAGGAYSDLGGLLLPAGAALEEGGSVKLGATSYRLQTQSQRFADDNGALDRYTLQPPAPASPVVVEVTYSTY
jgi:hypothetical protein